LFDFFDPNSGLPGRGAGGGPERSRDSRHGTMNAQVLPPRNENIENNDIEMMLIRKKIEKLKKSVRYSIDIDLKNIFITNIYTKYINEKSLNEERK